MMTRWKNLCGLLLAGALIAAPLTVLHAAVKPGVKRPIAAKKVRITKYLQDRVNAILTQLETHGRYRHAFMSLNRLFDLAIARDPADGAKELVKVDYARRLITQLASLSNVEHRALLLKLLLKNQELGETLAYLVESHRQPVNLIYRQLYKLHSALGDEIVKYPNLTAAICVTLYKPFHRHLNENLVTSPSPVAIFKYYVKYRHLMYFGIKNVPARLLIYVVDDTNSIKYMKWALARYHGDPLVGQLFFTIQYDYGALQPGAVKRVDRAGYDLPNILKYGGVCIDQAYFATAVGKAIGVPTAIDEGMSSVVGHAWVGFLQAQGNTGWWNFNTGRYSEYQGVIGTVKNPMTRRREPDDFMSISAQLIHTTQSDRWAAIALTDAARRLLYLREKHQQLSATTLPGNVTGARPKALANTPHNTLTLLQQAVDKCRGYSAEWKTVAVMARLRMLTLGEKEDWSERLMRLCGRRYPDFALAVLTPMINSVTNIRRRVRLWNRVFPWFAETRFDLAARIRMMQAAAWEKAKKDSRAGRYLMYVINRYTNAGPFVITALEKAAGILARQGHKNRILTLYEQTWLHIKPPPRDMIAFETESSWYQVGRQLEEMLKAQGHHRMARKVSNELESGGAAMRAQ
jgi:hypothetical protein